MQLRKLLRGTRKVPNPPSIKADQSYLFECLGIVGSVAYHGYTQFQFLQIRNDIALVIRADTSKHFDFGQNVFESGFFIDQLIQFSGDTVNRIRVSIDIQKDLRKQTISILTLKMEIVT